MIDTSHADVFGNFFQSDFFRALLTFIAAYFGTKHGSSNGSNGH